MDYQELSLDQKRKLCELAYQHSFKWWVDQLDCSKSMARESVDMSFEEILSRLKPSSHFIVIKRNNSWENHYEVGFREGVLIDHFLFIQVEVDVFEQEVLPKIEHET